MLHAMDRDNVLIGFLGTNLDAGRSASRWDRWRPTVAAAQHAEVPFTRFEVLYEERFEKLMRGVASDIAEVAPELEVRGVPIVLGDPWDFEAVYGALHDFVRGYEFRAEEDYLVHMTTGTHVAQICLFLLTESGRLPGRLFQTSPPRPRGAGGNGEFSIIDLDLARYDLLARRFEAERQEGTTFLKAGIQTKNAAFNTMIDRIERVAQASTDPLLLLGPTGAGKSDLARRIYQLKKRRGLKGPLVEVNCATIRGDQAMSALFGHRKGAFTGAQKDRPGLLKTADGGLLFLDEVGELGLDEQAMLLRAIEQKTFLPVGSDREDSSRFQLIAGTNRGLHERVRKGEFREDLLARLDLWTFELPGLAARREDIEPNLEFELERVGSDLGRALRFNAEGRRRFLDFAHSAPWPRNFRDFGAAIRRMGTLADGARLGPPDVEAEVTRLKSRWGSSEDAGRVERMVAEPLDRFDSAQLEAVLQVCESSASLSAAGRTLFAESRKKRTSVNDADRLRKYLARFGLEFRTIKEELSGRA